MRKYDPRTYGQRANRIRDGLRKEFRLHRCLFHHYDVIDFVVFEFGMRVTYLVSRVLSMLLIPLLLVSISDQFLAYDDTATPYSGLIYMHIWLSVLLVISVIFEVCALFYAAITLPTCEIVRETTVQWYFKVMWFMYNAVYVNILACGTMYAIFQLKSKIGLQYYYFLMVCAYAGIHCATTAIPTRMGHLMHPVSLTVLHIFFTAIYQYAGGTDPTGAHYVYDSMDWNYKIESILVALFWCFLTLFYHVSLVFSSWTRRKLFRRLRKGKEAIINYDPDDSSSVCSVDHDGEVYQDRVQPRIWMEDVPGDPMGHKKVTLDWSSPRKSAHEPAQYVFHEVYSDPRYPGERRKRLILESSPPAGARRYCFAPADTSGGPPPYHLPREFHSNSRRHQEKTYTCHPQASPDGRSVAFTCTPDIACKPECRQCDEERREDRAELYQQAGSHPGTRPHPMVLVAAPRSPSVASRPWSVDDEPRFSSTGSQYEQQAAARGSDEGKGSCLSRPFKKAKRKESEQTQTFLTPLNESAGTVIW